MPRRACALVLLVVVSAVPRADQKTKAPAPPPPIAPLNFSRALDLYADGRFDEAVTSVARAGDQVGRNLRRHWAIAAVEWIDAEPVRRPQRILAAAAFALETEHIRAERGDWRMTDGDPPCAASCVLDWAQLQLVQRGAPDRAERAWYLAAAALAGGVRDWRYLQRTINPERTPRLIPGLMERALARFPDDPSLHLERALAAAGRFNIMIDGGRRAASIPMPPGLLNGRGGMSISSLGVDPTVAADLLAALVNDPLVGVEARVRLGYLHWAYGHDEAAREELAKAAERTTDADLRYLAHFLLGQIAISRGDSAGAIAPLEAALAVRPGSQSAAVALAALELQRGNADKSHAIAGAALDQGGAAVDPWRLFLYGHHPRWPRLRAELRREIAP
jgi:tetratricopeptide (TPR) repeat protein